MIGSRRRSFAFESGVPRGNDAVQRIMGNSVNQARIAVFSVAAGTPSGHISGVLQYENVKKHPLIYTVAKRYFYRKRVLS